MKPLGLEVSGLDSEVCSSDSFSVRCLDPVYCTLINARSVFADGVLYESSLPALVDNYRRWLNEPTYLAFYSKKLDSYLFRKASKRGNDVYSFKTKRCVNDRVSFLDKKEALSLCVRRVGRRRLSNVLFITLTYNPSLTFWDINSAWLRISFEYNRFITGFRKKFGGAFVIKAVQSFYNGYPHIHLVVITSKSWDVKFHSGSDARFIVGDKELERISRMWHSFIDVRAVAPKRGESKNNGGSSAVKNYVLRDLLKAQVRDDDRDLKDWNTLALQWLHRKQSFSVSGIKLLREIVGDLITGMCNSNSDNDYGRDSGYIFVGCCIVRFVDDKPPPWIAEVNGDLCRDLGIESVVDRVDAEGGAD